MTTTTQAPWRIGATDAPLPPLESGLPLVGIAHKMTRDPLAYFVDLYKQHGSIFRVKLLNREIVVMAGLDANHFLQTDSDNILSSEKLFGDFGREFDTDTFMTAMDGEAHQRMRKQSRRGYSRSAMLPHTDDLISIVDEFTRDLQPGDEIPVLDTVRHIVTDQLGIVVADQRPGAYFPHLRRFLHFNMNVNVLKTWPRFHAVAAAVQRSKSKINGTGAACLSSTSPDHRHRQAA